MRRKSKTVFSLALAVGLLPATTVGASGSTPANEPATPQTRSVAPLPADMEGNVDLSVYELVEEIEQSTHRDVVNNYVWADGGLVLRTHGDTDDLDAFVTEAAATDGVRVSLISDAYDVEDLDAEAQRIAQLRTTPDGRVIEYAAPKTDGSGIVIGVAPTALDGAQSRRSAAPVPPMSAFPVEAIPSGPVELASRTNDTSPFWGGMLMNKPAEVANRINLCTTGFGVGRVVGSSLNSALLTADHCGRTGDRWRVGLSTAPLGRMDNTLPDGNGDLAIIDGTSAQGVVYVGGTASNSGTFIRGAVRPVLNGFLCYSGSRSGISCEHQVNQINISVCYTDAGCYFGLTRTRQRDGRITVGQGDSGGPVLAVTGGGDAYAMGIISGIQNGAGGNCQGVNDGRLCSATALFAPVAQFLDNNPGWGVLASAPRN